MKQQKNNICFRQVNDHDVDELYELLNELSNKAKSFSTPIYLTKRQLNRYVFQKRPLFCYDT